MNAPVGQTGFLTAALIGGTLYLIPILVLAGTCLGLLTYKPQYGLLFPISLIAAGHWRPHPGACGFVVGGSRRQPWSRRAYTAPRSRRRLPFSLARAGGEDRRAL